MSDMGGTRWGEITRDKILLLSFLGSLASLLALAITLADKVALTQNLAPQLAAWRAIGFLVFLVLSAATCAFWYVWAIPAFANQARTPPSRIVGGTWRTVVCLLVLGVFWDGLYAALYWQVWLLQFLYNFGALFKQLYSQIF